MIIKSTFLRRQKEKGRWKGKDGKKETRRERVVQGGERSTAAARKEAQPG